MSREITHGNLFSGSGTWELAAKLFGIKTLWEAEIEPFPVALEAKRFPEAIQLGDVSKINGAEIPPVDIFTNSSPCFAAGMMVRTGDGMKPIEDIQVGDFVLTHTGEFHEVLNSGCTGTKETVRLKAMGICDIVATPNHPFYVRHMRRRFPSFYVDGKRKRGNERVFEKPEWKPLRELTKKDYIGIPISGYELKSGLTEEELWLVGRYIADGYRRHDQPTVCFCIGRDKLQAFGSMLKDYHGYKDHGRTAVKYCITSKKLYGICGLCGDGAENKCFPSGFPIWNSYELGIVLDGYMSGDGSKKKDGLRAGTVSKKLALDIVYASGKANRLPCSLHYCKRNPTCVIEGRTVNQRDSYEVFCNLARHKQDKAFYEDGYVWLPIREISQNGTCDVYNLTVDADNSYTVNNIAVHNCQGLSIAGQRKGLNDDRSTLFSEAIRICKEMREADVKRQLHSGWSDVNVRPIPRYPSYFCWENVPGALSSHSGDPHIEPGADFKAVLESIVEIVQEERPDISIPVGGWHNSGILDGDNFQIAWRVIDAQYELPQRRRRVFVIASLRDRSAGEILFEREGLPWNFKTVASSWEDTSRSLEDRIDTASGIINGTVRAAEEGVEIKNG